METLAITNRIALLQSRKADNSNIIRKLQRKLRALSKKEVTT